MTSKNKVLIFGDLLIKVDEGLDLTDEELLNLNSNQLEILFKKSIMKQQEEMKKEIPSRYGGEVRDGGRGLSS